MADPIATADDLCELLAPPDWRTRRAGLGPILAGAGDAIDGALAEVERRGWLARLLPDDGDPSLVDGCIDGARALANLEALGRVLLAMDDAAGERGLDRLILRAASLGSLTGVFAEVVADGQYERMRVLLASQPARHGPALSALAQARPHYGEDALNAPALQFLAIDPRAADGDYDVIVVPGLTPIRTPRPLPLAEVPEAVFRLEAALDDFHAGRAPIFFVTGGCVHPPGTPYNEGLMMRDYLLGRGVPTERVVVDPYARHSTTNLRNAGRFMLAHGMRDALIVTGFDNPTVFDQAFYFGHPVLSDFDDRCRRDLGYVVGALRPVDEHRVAFTPSPQVEQPRFADPLDH